jgi:UbiD family decarboxylase
MVFIVFAWRKVPNALRYGICATVATFHDVLVTMGGGSWLHGVVQIQKKKAERLRAALQGTWQAEHLFALRQALQGGDVDFHIEVTAVS